MEMKFDAPLVSRVSYLDPAFTLTVIDDRGDRKYSLATLTPLSRVVTAVGLSYFNASGISPNGSSPNSVKFLLVNCNGTLASTAPGLVVWIVLNLAKFLKE